MDIKAIKEVIVLLEESTLEQIEIKNEDFEIKLKKPSVIIQNVPQVETIEVGQTKKEIVVEDKKNYFKAPIVGTCYLKPNPDAKEYISVGQQIKKGDILCIIEAMKVMNEIKAEQDGIIKEILVGNGEMVQYDQNLFLIE